MMTASHPHRHRIVIVGGGAGGLELAAKLGRRHGREHVFLVDQSPNHIWKPSLHEVAAGTLDIHREGLSYAVLARDRKFTFIHGRVAGVDRDAHTVLLDPLVYDGEEIYPARSVSYDTLVLAVGSRSNFFGTPGAERYAMALDSTEQAERFRQRVLKMFSIAAHRPASERAANLNITIVGGGATGVELAAELVEASRDMVYYGIQTFDPEQHMKITLLEGADRILSALPPKMSAAAHALLHARGIEVKTSVRIAEVAADMLFDEQHNRYPSDICVWAAGIKAPTFLADTGLDINRLNQVITDTQLRTSDASIFAMGDCAQVPWEEGGFLPARAQVAHQQADYLREILTRRIRGEDIGSRSFSYRDYGSLVSVGHSRGVGSLMGVLSGKSWFVEGLVARLMYMSLHIMHHLAVLGVGQTVLLAMGRVLLRRSTPRVKLH